MGATTKSWGGPRAGAGRKRGYTTGHRKTVFTISVPPDLHAWIERRAIASGESMSAAAAALLIRAKCPTCRRMYKSCECG